MRSGLLAHYEAIEFRLRLEYNHNFQSPYGFTASASLQSSLLDIGITATVTTGENAFEEQYVTVRVGDVSIPPIVYNEAVSGRTAYVEFINPRFYVDLAGYFVIYDSVEVRVGSDVVATLPAGLLRTYSFKPCDVPLVGDGVALSALISGGSLAFLPDNTPREEEAQAKAIGGWRYKLNNQWVALPIAVSVPPPRLNEGCTPFSWQAPPIGGTDTYNAYAGYEFWRYQYVDKWGARADPPCRCQAPNSPDGICRASTQHTWDNSATLFVIPNVPRAVERRLTPYQAVVRRRSAPDVYRFEEVRGFKGTSYLGDQNVECDFYNSELVKLYDGWTDTTAVVGETTHTIEQPLSRPVYCGYNANFNRIHERLVQVPFPDPDTGQDHCPPLAPSAYYQLRQNNLYFPAFGDDYNPYDWFANSDPVRAYINYHANPHWHYFYRFEDWSGKSALGYWLPYRSQYDPASRKRNQILDVLLGVDTNHPIGGIVQTLASQPAWWWGITRPAVVDGIHTPSKALGVASQPLWSFTNATAVFAANRISLTPTDSTVIAELDLGSPSIAPFFYPHLADAVSISASLVGEVSLVSRDGTARVIGQTNGSVLSLSRGQDATYAGTWTSLGETDERGTDRLNNGASVAVMNDAESREFWQMLLGGDGAKLRITFRDVVVGTLIRLSYPVFYHFNTRSFASYPELPNVGVLLTSTGRIQRYGATTHDGYGVLSQTQHATAYDALEARRRWLAPDITLTIAPFDSVEALSVNDLKIFSRSFLLPLYSANQPRWILLNLWRELPPIATLPLPHRDTGQLGCWSYSFSTPRRYLVANDRYPELVLGETNPQVVSTQYESFGDYRISVFDCVVDNDEVITNNQKVYLVRHGGELIARVVPFWGYSLLHTPLEEPAFLVLALDSRRQHLFVGLPDPKQLRTYINAETDLVLSKALTDPLVDLDYDERLSLLVGIDTARRLLRFHSQGRFYEVVMTNMPENAVVCVASKQGLWLLFLHDGGRLKRRVSDDGGDTWSTPSDVKVDNAFVDAKPTSAVYDERTNAVVLAFVQNNQRKIAVSFDLGATFKTLLTL